LRLIVAFFPFDKSHSKGVRSPVVLIVADLFHPIDEFTVELFLNGDMRHGRRRGRTMPMLLARQEPDHIAGMDLLDRTALALHPTATGGDNEDLRTGRRRGAFHSAFGHQQHFAQRMKAARGLGRATIHPERRPHQQLKIGGVPLCWDLYLFRHALCFEVSGPSPIVSWRFELGA
jgi:hypothetical protein